MGVTVCDVAQFFLNQSNMTHKKLQKLCYYSQAWHKTLYDELLFDEHFEAWVHGPVCPFLYQKYKSWGWQLIDEKRGIPQSLIDDPDKLQLLQEVYRIYGDLSGDDLEALTHSEEPWQIARKGLSDWEPSDTPIDPELMREYYLDLFERSQND